MNANRSTATASRLKPSETVSGDFLWEGVDRVSISKIWFIAIIGKFHRQIPSANSTSHVLPHQRLRHQLSRLIRIRADGG